MNQDHNVQLVYSVVIAVALIIGYVARHKNTNTPTLQYAMTWVGIFFVLILAYSFKERIMAELVPSKAIEQQGYLVISQSKDNHYYIDILVNGKKIKFLVDTGASDIAMNSADAEKVGIDLDKLTFNKIYSTANGKSAAASAVVATMQIDSVIFRDVKVSVNAGELDVSLLGMSFLERFDSFKFDGDKLYLKY